jgi:hypothetical protein
MIADHKAYFGAWRVKKFLAINISSHPRFQQGSRGRKVCIDVGSLPCLAALSGQPQEPGARRRKARAVHGKKRAPR